MQNKSSNKTRKIFILSMITLSIISIFVYNKFQNTDKNQEQNKTQSKDPRAQMVKVVEVEDIKTSSIQQIISFIGTIRAKRATTLIARAKGTLDNLLIAGQNVKKGALIAKIDNAEIEKDYELSKSSEKISKEQYERVSGLSKSGATSHKDVEDKKNAWIISQRALAKAKIELDNIMLHAPFDGVIGVFKIKDGSQVKEGDQIVSFYDPTSLIVEFDIPASEINDVNTGQHIRVNDKDYTLTYVQKMIDEETHMCPAYVDISCEKCIVGSASDVELTINKKDNVIVVPFESVFLKTGKNFVYTVVNNKAVLTPVELGIREKEKIEITKGLNVGQKIIKCGVERISPDMNVKVYNKKTQ